MSLVSEPSWGPVGQLAWWDPTVASGSGPVVMMPGVLTSARPLVRSCTWRAMRSVEAPARPRSATSAIHADSALLRRPSSHSGTEGALYQLRDRRARCPDPRISPWTSSTGQRSNRHEFDTVRPRRAPSRKRPADVWPGRAPARPGEIHRSGSEEPTTYQTPNSARHLRRQCENNEKDGQRRYDANYRNPLLVNHQTPLDLSCDGLNPDFYGMNDRYVVKRTSSSRQAR